MSYFPIYQPSETEGWLSVSPRGHELSQMGHPAMHLNPFLDLVCTSIIFPIKLCCQHYMSRKTRDFQQCGMCHQQSLTWACEYAQSDQSLCQLLEYSMTVKLLTKHHLEFLSLKGGCTCSSESTLVKMPHCWNSHVVAHTWASPWNNCTYQIYIETFFTGLHAG